MSIAWEEASRVLISNSDDLLLQDPASYLYSEGPARHKPCLSQLFSAVYPPYRTRPLSERAINLHHAVGYHVNSSELVSTILGYESWNPETISLLDTRTCWTLLRFFASTLANCYDIEEWLDHLRLLVKHGFGPMSVQNVDLSHHYGSPLCSYVAVAALEARALNQPNSWSLFEQSARSACVSWLQHLSNAGLDLEFYGQCESRLLGTDRSQQVRQYCESHPAIELSQPILALSHGPALSDWHLWLDCAYDQWAGDFWCMLGHNYFPLLPGAWIDEDEERAVQLRSQPGRFKSLATSRRKRRRYLRFMQISDDYACLWLGSFWESSAHINGKLRDYSRYKSNWCNWPPLIADLEGLSINERVQPAGIVEYCSVCDDWKPLVEYYDFRPSITGVIRGGMCHGGDNEVL